MKPVSQVSDEQVQALLKKGAPIVCLVSMNDDFGLRLTAIDFVFDDGKPAVIDIPTISPQTR